MNYKRIVILASVLAFLILTFNTASAWTARDMNTSQTDVNRVAADGNFVVVTIDGTVAQSDSVMVYKLKPDNSWTSSSLNVDKDWTTGGVDIVHAPFGSNAGTVQVTLWKSTQVVTYYTTLSEDGTFNAWTGPNDITPTTVGLDDIIDITGASVASIANGSVIGVAITGDNGAGESYVVYNEGANGPTTGANFGVVVGPTTTADSPLLYNFPVLASTGHASEKASIAYRETGEGILISYYDAGWKEITAAGSPKPRDEPFGYTSIYYDSKTYTALFYKSVTYSAGLFKIFNEFTQNRGGKTISPSEVIPGNPIFDPVAKYHGVIPYTKSTGDVVLRYFSFDPDRGESIDIGAEVDTGDDADYWYEDNIANNRPIAWINTTDDQVDIAYIKSTNTGSTNTDPTGDVTIDTSASYDFKISGTDSDCDEIAAGSCGDTIAGVNLTDETVPAEITIADSSDDTFRVTITTFLDDDFDLSGTVLAISDEAEVDKITSDHVGGTSGASLVKKTFQLPYAPGRTCVYCPAADEIGEVFTSCGARSVDDDCSGTAISLVYGNDVGGMFDPCQKEFSNNGVNLATVTTGRSSGALTQTDPVLPEIPLTLIVPLVVVIVLTYLFVSRRRKA